MSATMKEQSTGPLYDLWARFYDGTFGKLVERRQRAALAAIRAQPGQRVLDLGVGTGMTLPHYPPDVKVVGMDLSGGMLDKAREKAERENLADVALVQGDAMHPPFAPHSFDHVLVTHVISVVSDPARLLRVARTMVKPGGRVVILNHFASTHPVVRFFERLLNPIFLRIGWKSDLDLAEVLRACPMGLEHRFKLARLDLWQIVVLSDSPTAGPALTPEGELSRPATVQSAESASAQPARSA